MARPSRNNVDYFPFLCKEGKAMYYIETTYGNDGYATWVKILRELAVANNHYLNLADKVNLMFLASKCRVSQDVLIKILNDLSDLGEINAELWTTSKVIWNEKFIDHIQDAYSKRSNQCIDLDSLRILLTGLGILKPSLIPLKGSVKPQSKEEYSKEEENIVKKASVLIYPFDSENFIMAWREWIEYKKSQFKFEYKSIESQQTALNDLLKISLGAEFSALEIIQNAIAKGWKGLYAIKKDQKQENSNDTYSKVMQAASGHGR